MGYFRAVVVVNEEVDGDVVHEIRFGKGGGFAGESADSLAQGAVESLDVISWPISVRLLQLLSGHNAGIGLPNIGEAASGFVSLWNPTPQHAAGFHPPTADGKGHNLPGAPAQG